MTENTHTNRILQKTSLDVCRSRIPPIKVDILLLLTGSLLRQSYRYTRVSARSLLTRFTPGTSRTLLYRVILNQTALTTIFLMFSEDSATTKGSGFSVVPIVHMIRLIILRPVYPPVSGGGAGVAGKFPSNVVSRKYGSSGPDSNVRPLNSPLPMASMIMATVESSKICSVITCLSWVTKKSCQPDPIAGNVERQSRGSGIA